MENSLISEFKETCGDDFGLGKVVFTDSCSVEGESFEKLADFHSVNVSMLNTRQYMCVCLLSRDLIYFSFHEKKMNRIIWSLGWKRSQKVKLIWSLYVMEAQVLWEILISRVLKVCKSKILNLGDVVILKSFYIKLVALLMHKNAQTTTED